MWTLKPGHLRFEDIVYLLKTKTNIQLDKKAYQGIKDSLGTVQAILKKEEVIYGINTGFGRLATESIELADLKELQKRMIMSHAAGIGEPLAIEIVQLVLLLKINALAQGYSGVSLEFIEALIWLYNEEIYPLIPSQGSVGASGDLAPLAYIGLSLIGMGKVYYHGEIRDVKTLYAQYNKKPYSFREKEGLSLLNGTQVSTAIALIGLMKTQKNFLLGTIAGALSVEASSGSVKPFAAGVARLKNNRSVSQFSEVMRSLLEDSEIQNAHADCGKVQDPYSLRCQPQVMGAILSYLKDSKTHLMEEANAVSDNPLVFANSHDVISGGNFHAEIVGFSADILGMIGAEIGAISERRVAHLMDTNMSGLPPFLVKKPGLNSGFMMAQVTAAALASENKVYAHPASVDSLPTSANQEDHVSMAPFAGMKLLKIAKNVHAILMIEILAACQGIDLRKPLRPAKKLQKYMDKIRAHIPFYEKDGYLGHDFELALVITTQDEFDGDIDDAFFKENS